jgi:hypothetical protein
MQGGHDVRQALVVRERPVTAFSRCAGNGFDDGSRHSFYLARTANRTPSSALFAHSSDCLVDEAEACVSFAWIPRPQRVRDPNNLALADRSEIPAVERIEMWLEEEELAGKEGETPIPCRQGPAFGIVIKRLGG